MPGWSWFPLGLGLLVLFLLSPPGVHLRRWAMARAYTRTMARHEEFMAERKRALLAGLSGTVLELGPGPGVNFRYLPLGRVERWIGVEPNPFMAAKLRATATEATRDAGIPAEVRGVAAEGMEVEAGSVDCVLATLVLCSVPDPAAVLADVRRVLRPGGTFVFLEHVAAPPGTGLRRLQSCVKPLWWCFADGCRPDRDLGAAIRAAGFARVDIDEFDAHVPGLPPVVRPHVAGVAVTATATLE